MPLPARKIIKAGLAVHPIGALVSAAIPGGKGKGTGKRRRRKHLTQSQKNDVLWISAHVSKKAAGNYLAGRGF